MKRFFKDAMIYALPIFLARAIGLALLPVYTRLLGPTDFGFIEFIAASSSVLLLVLSLEINQAVARMLPEATLVNGQKNIISTAFWFTSLVFVLFAVIVFYFRLELLNIANLPSHYGRFAILVCLNMIFTAVVNLLQTLFRFTNKAKASVIINTAVVIANMIIVLYYSFTNNLGILQYYISQVISGFIGLLFGITLLTMQYGRFQTNIDLTVLKELLKFSFPIVLSSIGIVIAGNVDRVMIGSFIGLTELGYYGAALRLAAIAGLGFYVISSAITPIVYSEHEIKETRNFIANIFNYTVYISLLLLLVLIVFPKQIIIFLAGEKFANASNYVFYLMLSSVISNLCIFFLGMDITKNTKLLCKINLTSGLLGTVVCVLMVPLVGIWGAITASISANVLRLAGYIHFSQMLYPLPVRFYLIITSVIALVILNQFLIFS